MPSRRDQLLQSLRPGDVLLVEGSSRIAAAIKYLTQSTWSHATLYVGPQLGGLDEQGEPYLFIEADMVQGVCKRPLSHYQSFHTRICRPFHLGDADRELLLSSVVGKLGERYDLKNVVDLARYLLPRPPVPGRWRRQMLALGSGDPTRAICSSLIAEAFQGVGYPVLPTITFDRHQDPRLHRAVTEEIFHIRDRSLFAPRDFDVSPYFEIIKPTLAARLDYRHIHWE
ncbi:lipo-like protein [Variovorax terrae]|uniref:Lipo-like protein n=1 Tax=Variovorax terrae TaxID=2923278 RepID=A0A9X1VXT9_9BURK|nr:lipo-like protein [Variovorax terrae]MCJ0765295.1 lipo-like protein [Variovorax terrae]